MIREIGTGSSLPSSGILVSGSPTKPLELLQQYWIYIMSLQFISNKIPLHLYKMTCIKDILIRYETPLDTHSGVFIHVPR